MLKETKPRTGNESALRLASVWHQLVDVHAAQIPLQIRSTDVFLVTDELARTAANLSNTGTLYTLQM